MEGDKSNRIYSIVIYHNHNNNIEYYTKRVRKFGILPSFGVSLLNQGLTAPYTHPKYILDAPVTMF